MLYINVRENGRGNQEWTIQRRWQHWTHKKRNKTNKTQKTQHNTNDTIWFKISSHTIYLNFLDISNNIIVFYWLFSFMESTIVNGFFVFDFYKHYIIYMMIHVQERFTLSFQTTYYLKISLTFHYSTYIVAVGFIGGWNRNTRRNHRPAASHWQTLSYNVVSKCTSDF